MIQMNDKDQLDHEATTNVDVQEAHSIRFGATAFMVMPLRSGKIAVLGYARDLHAICDNWEEACAAAESIDMNRWRKAVEAREGKNQYEPSRPQVELKTDKSAGDLGL